MKREEKGEKRGKARKGGKRKKKGEGRGERGEGGDIGSERRAMREYKS